MLKIQNVTNGIRQNRVVDLPDGTSITLEMYFVPNQYGWYVTILEYGDFKITGMRICNSPNMLRQFRNLIPFGLACISKGGREPTLQQDFSTENSILYILTQQEVLDYEDFLRE